MRAFGRKDEARTGAMQLDGRQSKLLCDFSVLDRAGGFERQALDALSHVAARGDSRAAPERLELDVADNAVLVHADLQLHDIATSVVGSSRHTTKHTQRLNAG